MNPRNHLNSSGFFKTQSQQPHMVQNSHPRFYKRNMKLPLKLSYFEIIVTQELSPFSFCLLSSLGMFIYSHFQAKAFMKSLVFKTWSSRTSPQTPLQPWDKNPKRLTTAKCMDTSQLGLTPMVGRKAIKDSLKVLIYLSKGENFTL